MPPAGVAGAEHVQMAFQQQAQAQLAHAQAQAGAGQRGYGAAPAQMPGLALPAVHGRSGDDSGFWAAPRMATPRNVRARHSAPGDTRLFGTPVQQGARALSRAGVEQQGHMGKIDSLATLAAQLEPPQGFGERGPAVGQMPSGAGGAGGGSGGGGGNGGGVLPSAFAAAAALAPLGPGVGRLPQQLPPGADTAAWLSGQQQQTSDRASDFSRLLSGLLGTARPGGGQHGPNPGLGLSVRSQPALAPILSCLDRTGGLNAADCSRL